MNNLGHFVLLGQFAAQKMPVKQWFFMSASVGHFVAGEEMGHFVAGTICCTGRKWDSSRSQNHYPSGSEQDTTAVQLKDSDRDSRTERSRRY